MDKLIKSIISFFEAKTVLSREERAEKRAMNAQFRQTVSDQWAKRQQYKALVGAELSYPIIQDMINAVTAPRWLCSPSLHDPFFCPFPEAVYTAATDKRLIELDIPQLSNQAE